MYSEGMEAQVASPSVVKSSFQKVDLMEATAEGAEMWSSSSRII